MQKLNDLEIELAKKIEALKAKKIIKKVISIGGK
jgi:hypothetical protein